MLTGHTPNKPWMRFDVSLLQTPGVVVDLGCLNWDWPPRFTAAPFNRKVYGYDPFEQDEPEGCTLFNEVVTSDLRAGNQPTVTLTEPARASVGRTTYALGESEGESWEAPQVGWSKVERDVGDNPIALLKINIEGGEYDLIHSWVYAPAAQIVVSFHHWVKHLPFSEKQTQRALAHLVSLGYDIVTPTCPNLGWYCLVAREGAYRR